jgi:carboxylesterase
MTVELHPYANPEHQPFEFGDGAATSLLIHGFPGTPAEMRSIGQALSEIGWRARGVLLPGFGPDIINLYRRGRKDWLSAAKSAWLNIREPSHPAVLIGYSMGAAVALNLIAAQPPDLLVLISPFWRLPGLLSRLVPVAKWLMPEIFPFKKADFTDPKLRDQFQRIIPDVDLDDPQVQDMIRTEFRLPLQTIDEILQLGKEAYQHAEQVDMPTLVIQGKNDSLVRPSDTIKLVQRLGINCVDYHELDGGHDLIQNGSVNRSRVNDLIIQQVTGLR